MGWNSWNTFGPDIHEDLLRQTADSMVETGLRDAGYEYLVIDDFWEADRRDADDRLTWDVEKFPSGIPALADYVHQRGLKFGIYSCAGTCTCGGKPSSFGYEEVDATTFAEWGVDFLKYDFCYHPMGTDGPALYRRMGQALRSTGREILFSLCEWGHRQPWTWARSVGGHMWRTTGDINDSWESIRKLAERQRDLAPYAGPGGWNDPDMLVVGMGGAGHVGREGGCTHEEYRTHMGYWAMLCSPLMIGCDVRKMDEPTRELLLNPEVIAVNQDPLGAQAVCLGRGHFGAELWYKPLVDGSVAVGVFNWGDEKHRSLAVAWEALGIHDRRECVVRDLWARAEIGTFTRAVNAAVAPHHSRVLKITPLGLEPGPAKRR
jgi:alpha-galactosidase